ncbi:hypothetical protein CTI12_AA338690 [Artemisia annua]|uniref:Uncharacterized protein n=1 Tax=Artemisia annua TaxID=35608 RepID=A0A2U1MTM7_ARTAN|nr:hypothetical protein CTI12_AA338690 [Artemisia annua]
MSKKLSPTLNKPALNLQLIQALFYILGHENDNLMKIPCYPASSGRDIVKLISVSVVPFGYSKSFARISDEETQNHGVRPSRGGMYCLTRTREDGSIVNATAAQVVPPLPADQVKASTEFDYDRGTMCRISLHLPVVVVLQIGLVILMDIVQINQGCLKLGTKTISDFQESGYAFDMIGIISGTKTHPVNEVIGHQKLHESKSHCVRKRTHTTSPRSAYLEDATTTDNGYAYLQQQQPANFLTKRSVENEHVGSSDVADEHVG